MCSKLRTNHISVLFQKHLYRNQKNININNIYDEEFVSLINALSESIKEYYKISRNIITRQILLFHFMNNKEIKYNY